MRRVSGLSANLNCNIHHCKNGCLDGQSSCTYDREDIGSLESHVVYLFAAIRAFGVSRDDILWNTLELLQREADYAILLVEVFLVQRFAQVRDDVYGAWLSDSR